MKTIYQQLAKAKKEIGAISKDSKNPFFKSKYFDINQLLHHVEPILEKHGLFILQPIKINSVITEIIHADSSEKVSSSLLIPELKDPQKIGACITYYRRFTLTSLLSLQSEDNDGNDAKPEKDPPAPKKTPLTEDGYLYLATKGTKADILKAKETRILTKEQLKGLDELLKDKKV